MATAFLEKGVTVIGTVRNLEDGEDLKKYNEGLDEPVFHLMKLDVTNNIQISQLLDQIKEIVPEGQYLDAIINNAGIAVHGPMTYLKEQELYEQFEVNFFGVFKITQNLAILLRPNGGKIINMSSVSSDFSFPFLGAYAASKSALDSLSDAWRRELLPKKQYVVKVLPGPIKTAIWDKGLTRDDNMYEETEYGTGIEMFKKMAQKMASRGIEPQKLASLVYRIVNLKSPKPKYYIGHDKLFYRLFLPLLPTSILDKLVVKQLKLNG